MPGARPRPPALVPLARFPGHRRRAGRGPPGQRPFDAHRDGPEFGYRYLADEARDAGHSACDRTMWRVCSSNGWWSAFGKKREKNGKKPGPPVHDDLVHRDFTADAPNQQWLADITEHKTTEGKLYVCAITDVISNRIVGYSISDRMKSRLGRGRAGQRRRPTW